MPREPHDILGGRFFKSEIIILDTRKALPALGVWGATTAAAPPAASWEASLGTTVLRNRFWFVACF